MLAACFFCHLQDQQQAQGHQQLFIRALPEEEEEDGQQQQVPGIHTAQVKLVQQMPERAAGAVGPVAAGGGGGGGGGGGRCPNGEAAARRRMAGVPADRKGRCRPVYAGAPPPGYGCRCPGRCGCSGYTCLTPPIQPEISGPGGTGAPAGEPVPPSPAAPA